MGPGYPGARRGVDAARTRRKGRHLRLNTGYPVSQGFDFYKHAEGGGVKVTGASIGAGRDGGMVWREQRACAPSLTIAEDAARRAGRRYSEKKS